MFQALPSCLASVLGTIRPPSFATAVIDVESVASKAPYSDAMVVEEFPAFTHTPYMTNAVPVCKRRSSGTMARSPEQCHLGIATEAAIAVGKKGNVFIITEDVE